MHPFLPYISSLRNCLRITMDEFAVAAETKAVVSNVLKCRIHCSYDVCTCGCLNSRVISRTVKKNIFSQPLDILYWFLCKYFNIDSLGSIQLHQCSGPVRSAASAVSLCKVHLLQLTLSKQFHRCFRVISIPTCLVMFFVCMNVLGGNQYALQGCFGHCCRFSLGIVELWAAASAVLLQ